MPPTFNDETGNRSIRDSTHSPLLRFPGSKVGDDNFTNGHLTRCKIKANNQKLILGLGNSLRGDDGIGLHLVTELEQTFGDKADFVKTEEMGLALLDYLSGYEEAVIIDSIRTVSSETGTVHFFRLEDFPPRHSQSNHFTGLPEAAEIANSLNIPFPRKVHIAAVEVANPFDISPTITPDLQKQLPQILGRLESFLEQILS